MESGSFSHQAKLKEEDAVLAGEMSGHLFFADRYYGYDDAIYAGARLLELLSRSEMTFQEIAETLPKMYNTLRLGWSALRI